MSIAAQLQPVVDVRHREVLRAALAEVEVQTVRAAPEATGYLKRQIRALPLDETGPVLSGEIVADTAYAGFTDAGTQPHLIFPKRARVLAWEGAGGAVFAHRVNHPGTRGTHWFTGGEDGGDPMRSRWQLALQSAVT